MNLRMAILMMLALSGALSVARAAEPVGAVPVQSSGRALRASPIDGILSRLREDPEGLAVFARSALDEMLRDYDNEIDRVEQQLRGGTSVPAEIYTWYRGAIESRNDLGATREQITDDMTIDTVAEAGGNTRLLLDGRSVMIDTPRLSGKIDLLQRIAKRTCEAIDCVTAAPEHAAVARTRQASGTWSFSDRRAPAYEADHRGVQCLFQDNAHLLLKKQVCERVLVELEQALNALQTLHQSGRFIDWSQVKIVAAANGAHRLVVDGYGNFVDVSLPSLYRLGAQFERVVTWLRARSAGEPAALDLLIENRLVYANATTAAPSR